MKKQSYYGLQAKAQMDSGELVSDNIVIPLLEDKVHSPECRRGFILDGFPRTIEQAKSLQTLLSKDRQSLDGVVYFDIADDDLRRRVCGRRVHPASGRLYHVEFKPPKVSGIDDVSGEPLVHRQDDNEETLRHRMSTFRNETLPLVDYYSKLGLLYKLDATRTSDNVKKELFDVVERSWGGAGTA